jgi:predicted metal-binding membrane protein
MHDSILDRVLRRDRLIVAAALGALTALAWVYVIWLAADVGTGGGMGEMPGMRMIPAGVGWMVADRLPWSAPEIVLVFIMWSVMMIGMMTPSAAPMVLIYARIGRQAAERRRPFAAAGWFAAGYLSVWVAFSLAATLAQWALQRAALLDSMMKLAERRLEAALLIAAGLYQWTTLKSACLAKCRSPLALITQQGGFRGTPAGAWQLGVRHGLYCLGCCWAVMLLLFVGGIMNVLWIAALAVLVLVEKIARLGRIAAMVAGVAFAGAGVWLLLTR